MAQLSRKTDRQQESIQLSLIDGHPMEAGEGAVSLALILSQPDLLSAIKLSINVSGLQDKQLAGVLGIDVAQFSRIKSGDAHLPPNKLHALMRRCRNHIPLTWLAHQSGYELRPMRSTLEQQLETAKAVRDDIARQLETIKALVRDTRR